MWRTKIQAHLGKVMQNFFSFEIFSKRQHYFKFTGNWKGQQSCMINLTGKR